MLSSQGLIAANLRRPVWIMSLSDVTNVFHGAKMITTILSSCGLRVISGAECDFDCLCCFRPSRSTLKPTRQPPDRRLPGDFQTRGRHST